MITATISLDHIVPSEEPLSLCLGNFDGMHLGHQEVLFQCRYDGCGVPAILFLDPTEESLDQLPFLKQNALMGIEDKVRFVHSKQIEIAYILKSDLDVYALSPESFIEKVLKPLNVKEVFCGEDYRFGANASGDINLLKKHFKVHALPLKENEGRKISTTWIKELIEAGQVEEAYRLLGHVYEISGKVNEGYHRGTDLGFPTANLSIHVPYLLPRTGVYFGDAFVNGISHIAMINIGDNPTFHNQHKTIEVHLIGYEGPALYGKKLYLQFLGFLREEIAFENKEALIAQLEIDKKNTLDRIYQMQGRSE